MSRSGYTEDGDDPWALIRWRGAVASAIRGKRGQAFLRELADAMDAMPERRLGDGENGLADSDGCACAVGVVMMRRGMSALECRNADAFVYRESADDLIGIAGAMAAEIFYENDERMWGPETSEARWKRMRKWVSKQLTPPPEGEPGGDRGK